MKSVLVFLAFLSPLLLYGTEVFVGYDNNGPLYGKTSGTDVVLARFPHCSAESLGFGVSKDANHCIWINPGAAGTWLHAAFDETTNDYVVQKIELAPAIATLNGDQIAHDDDLSVVRLSKQSRGAVSNEGKSMAIACANALYVIDLAAGVVTYRHLAAGTILEPSWSPDSKKLAFFVAEKQAAETRGGFSLYLYDTESNSVFCIVPPSHPTATAFSPDAAEWNTTSTRLYFISNYSEKPLWRVAYRVEARADAPSPTAILPGKPLISSLYSNGKRLFLISRREIFTIDFDRSSEAVEPWGTLREDWTGMSYRFSPSAALTLFSKWDELWIGSNTTGECRRLLEASAGKPTWLRIK